MSKTSFSGPVESAGGFTVDDNTVIDESGITPTATVTADDSESTLNTIQTSEVQVEVDGTTNDANDFIVLPSLANVNVGHTITIACNAGSNFEMRTPASSGEKINNVDSDGTQEYLCTDTDVVVCRKISDTDGWTAQSFQVDGSVRTAVTPD